MSYRHIPFNYALSYKIAVELVTIRMLLSPIPLALRIITKGKYHSYNKIYN